MWKLFIIFWLTPIASAPLDFVPEKTAIEFEVDYTFTAEAGCILSAQAAYKREGAAWAIANMPDYMGLKRVSRDCRFTPKWAGRQHRNVGPVDR